jgi:hypothetical protein
VLCVPLTAQLDASKVGAAPEFFSILRSAMEDRDRQIFINRRERVLAPPTVAWSLLLDEIRNPNHYIPGVTDVSFPHEGGTHFVERKMKIGVIECHEIISADPNVMSVVHRSHASHPVFTGFVSTTVLPDPESDEELVGHVGGKEPDSCVLDFTIVMSAKPAMPMKQVEEARSLMSDAVGKTLQYTRRHAEEISHHHFKGVEGAAAGIRELHAEPVKG